MRTTPPSEVTSLVCWEGCRLSAIASLPAARSLPCARWMDGGSRVCLSISIRSATAGRANASRNRRTQKRSRDHARRIGPILSGDVERCAVIRGRARKWKTQRDVYRASKRCNLDRSHPNVVVRCDHSIELSPHGAHEDCVSRKRSIDSCSTRGGGENIPVLVAESPAVAGVRVERAQCDARLGNIKPFPESMAGDTRCLGNRVRTELLRNLPQRNVSRSQYDPQL